MTIKYDNLYEKIIDFDNLLLAYYQTLKGAKKYRRDAINFSMLEDLNLVRLWQDLKSGHYRIQEYTRFKVYEPKERVIHAPRFRDKIVQCATHNILKEVYENVYIAHSYACIEGRGTHAAVDQVQKNMRICEREWGDAWIVKFDVSKFFYSIDRDILKRLLRKQISCRKTIWLLDLIIDSSPEGEKGIPLGNVTSQDFANIYLNELDQFVKRYCKVRYYVRYMDDAIAVVKTREEAAHLKRLMIWFVREILQLHENPKKTQIFPLKQGVNAYGYKIWTSHRKVRDESKKAMKRRIKAMDKKMQLGKITEKELLQAVYSWLGHARHSNSYNLCKKIFNKYDYINIEGDDYFGKRRFD